MPARPGQTLERELWAPAPGRRRQTRQRPGWGHRDSLPPLLTPAPAWQPRVWLLGTAREAVNLFGTFPEELEESGPIRGFHNSQEEEDPEHRFTQLVGGQSGRWGWEVGWGLKQALVDSKLELILLFYVINGSRAHFMGIEWENGHHSPPAYKGLPRLISSQPTLQTGDSFHQLDAFFFLW